ncbi:MAG: hypothetical protein A2Y40_08100 [Candidatus Margulisbacteria bacterium GWF2_35_9]|nr:MAG: hypothetical protein A2Y40_08100 [Candidatus Margulisbacteria bacterium GWF2_35_9]
MGKKTTLFTLALIFICMIGAVSNSYANEITNDTALRRLIKNVIMDYHEVTPEILLPENDANKTDNIMNTTISKGKYEDCSKTMLWFDSTATNKMLPGIVSGGDFDARLYVRGGRSNELLTIVDGQEIKSPYLWDGKVSLINPLLIEDVYFYSGAIPAKYPVSLSGVLDIVQKKGDLKKVNVEIDQNLTEFQFLIDGPIQKMKHSFLYSVRKTFYDYMFRIPNTILPHLDSFSQKYLFSLTSDHRLFVDMSYYSDMMVVDNLNINQGIKGKHSSGSIRKMFLGNLESNWGEKLKSNLSMGYEDSFATWKVEKEIPTPNSSTGVAYDSKPAYIKLDVEMSQFEGHKVMTGIGFRQENLNYEEENINMLTNLDYPGSVRKTNSENYTSSYQTYALYLQDEISMNPFTIVAGLRYCWIPNNHLSHSTSLQPRLTVSLKDITRNATLFASIGKYETFNNPVNNGQLVDVLPEQVIQYSVGIEEKVNINWQWKTEVFVKRYSSLVDAKRDSSTGEIVSYDNSKIGRVYGLEFLLRKENASDWNFWLSYTYSNAKYLESSSNWYSADHDQAHTFNLFSTYKLSEDWSFVANWTVSSGKPYTDIVGANYDTSKNVYIPIKAAKNAERLPGYNNLTISFEYQKPIWPFDQFTGSTYIGATNLLNQSNIYGYSWSDDYTTKTEIRMLPFVPIFGIRINF